MRHGNNLVKRVWALLLTLTMVLAAVAIPGGTAQAQAGEVITYGASLIGDLTAERSFVIYSLTMNAGDMMSFVVVGLTTGMSPSVGMVGPDQLPIADSDDDPLSAASGRLARLDYRATQTGTYSLIVTNSNNTSGQFAVMLDGRPAPVVTTLSLNTIATANVLPNSAPIAYSFQPSTSGNLILSINTSTPGFSFLARVYDGFGHLIARLAGVDLRGVSLDIGPGNGQYLVEVGALTTDQQGSIQIGLVPGNVVIAPPAPPATLIPAATPTPSVCQATGRNRVNIRSGPGTAYPAFGSLYPGTILSVIGRSNTTSIWYVVNYNGQQGWVSGSVVDIGGPCDALQFVSAPPLPVTPTPIPTATPFATAAPTVSFTSTIADGMTYPAGTCFTFYWTVTNVREVYFDGIGVSGQGQREACPTASRSYVLRVVLMNGAIQDFPIPVSITP